MTTATKAGRSEAEIEHALRSSRGSSSFGDREAPTTTRIDTGEELTEKSAKGETERASGGRSRITVIVAATEPRGLSLARSATAGWVRNGLASPMFI